MHTSVIANCAVLPLLHTLFQTTKPGAVALEADTGLLNTQLSSGLGTGSSKRASDSKHGVGKELLTAVLAGIKHMSGVQPVEVAAPLPPAIPLLLEASQKPPRNHVSLADCTCHN